MTQKTLTSRGWVELALLSLVWGGSFLAIRTALDEIGPLTIVAHRVGWAALALWGVLLATSQPVPRGLRAWGAFAAMGVLNNLLPFGLIAWGQIHIATGLASILNAATAIFGVLIASLAFADERLTPRRAAGVALGFAGVVAAIGWRALTDLDIRSFAQLAVIGASLCYALGGVWARVAFDGMRPEVAAGGTLAASAVMALPLAWAVEGRPSLALTPATWGALAYISLMATAFAYLLYYRLVASAGSGNVLLCTLMIPPIAIGLGTLVLGEALRPAAYGGFALLAAGLLVLDGRILRGRAGAIEGARAPR